MFVIIGRDAGARDASLAVGPFVARGRAEAEADRLCAATAGVYVVLPLFVLADPDPAPEEEPMPRPITRPESAVDRLARARAGVEERLDDLAVALAELYSAMNDCARVNDAAELMARLPPEED